MANENRTAADALAFEKAIEARPYEFDFYHALRRLECLRTELPRLGESVRPADDGVRLGQEPSLAFAPSTLAAFEPGKDGAPGRLRCNFFGMFGPNGPLPLHLTEYARDRERNHEDHTFRRFMDVFHHRLLSLFFRAWANAEPTVQLDRPDKDRFAAYVGSLFGLGTPSTTNRDSVSDHAKLHFAGRLSCQTAHPEGLQKILNDFFQVPVRVEEFVGNWLELPDDCHCRLGEPSQMASMGKSILVGSRIWDCQTKFRVEVGPVSLSDYLRFLPGGDSLSRLSSWISNYVGDELIWDLKLILMKEEIPRLRLGQAGRLGWDGWVASKPHSKDSEDLLLQSQAASGGNPNRS